MYQDYEDLLKAYFVLRDDQLRFTEAMMQLHQPGTVSYQLAQMYHNKVSKGGQS